MMRRYDFTLPYKPNESRLTIISIDYSESPSRAMCSCSCGNVKAVRADHVIGLKIRSCGCISKDYPPRFIHGDSDSAEHAIWIGMIDRCTKPKDPAFKDYGGRGITVCERWMDYRNFLADMGRKASPGHSLDRRNNDLGYSPDNCRWATQTEQARNRRTTAWVILKDGRKVALSEAAETLGVCRSQLQRRIHHDPVKREKLQMEAMQIIETMVDIVESRKICKNIESLAIQEFRPGERVTVDGVDFPSIKQASRALGISYGAMLYRLKRKKH